MGRNKKFNPSRSILTMDHYSLEIRAMGDVMFKQDAMTLEQVISTFTQHGIVPRKKEWKKLKLGVPVEFTDVILPTRTVTLMGFQDQDYKPEDAPETKSARKPGWHYTEGPWIADDGAIYTMQKDFVVILDVCDNGADAELMAASPELLEALQGYVDYYDDPEKVLSAGEWHLLQVAKAAIRKAGGI